MSNYIIVFKDGVAPAYIDGVVAQLQKDGNIIGFDFSCIFVDIIITLLVYNFIIIKIK